MIYVTLPRDSNTGVRWIPEDEATGLGMVSISLLMHTGHGSPSLCALQPELCVPSGPFVALNELELSWRGCQCPNALWCLTLCRSAISICFGWHGYKKVVHL